MPSRTSLSWDTGATFDDAVRDLRLPDLVAGLKERNDPGLWDAFFAHMDTTLGPDATVDTGADLSDAREDLGDAEAADMAIEARVSQLRERVRQRLRMIRSRY